MYKQIFDKSNSYPELIESVYDDETGEEYFDYDKEKYTDLMPRVIFIPHCIMMMKNKNG